MWHISLPTTLDLGLAGGALAAPLAGSGKMRLCCALLDVTLSTPSGTKTRVTEEGFLVYASAHAQVRSASRTTMLPSPNKNSATDRTHYMDDILVYSALLLWHIKVSVFL